MKRGFYMGFIALATLSMVGCSNDEVYEGVPQTKAIEFGTYLGRNTKGIVLDNNNFNEFGVIAFYTQKNNWETAEGSYCPNFMYNQSVSKTTDAWTYSPKKYWPTTQGDMITFFAYAPMAAANNGISITGKDKVGTPVVTYQIATDNLANIADFVADALIDQTKAGNGESLDGADRTVSFTLNHELTRLAFTAKLDRDAWSDTDAADKTKVNITSIKLVGGETSELYSQADYTFAKSNDTEAATIRGTWGNYQTADNGLSIDVLLNKEAAANMGGYTKEGILIGTQTEVSLFKTTNNGSEYLFMIPTDESGLAANGAIKMEISYDIVTVDAALKDGYSVTSATKIVDFPAETLKQGYAYNFALTFGLNEIKLSATIADWVETDSNNGNVDWPKFDAE